MFFSTPTTQDFDPFEMVPNINQRASNKNSGAISGHQVIDQLLLLFISKSEVVSKAID